MASITYGAVPAEGAKNEGHESFFTRLVNSMMAARTQQAETYVNMHLLSLSDMELKKLGKERWQLQRTGAPVAIF